MTHEIPVCASCKEPIHGPVSTLEGLDGRKITFHPQHPCFEAQGKAAEQILSNEIRAGQRCLYQPAQGIGFHAGPCGKLTVIAIKRLCLAHARLSCAHLGCTEPVTHECDRFDPQVEHVEQDDCGCTKPVCAHHKTCPQHPQVETT